MEQTHCQFGQSCGNEVVYWLNTFTVTDTSLPIKWKPTRFAACSEHAYERALKTAEAIHALRKCGAEGNMSIFCAITTIASVWQVEFKREPTCPNCHLMFNRCVCVLARK